MNKGDIIQFNEKHKWHGCLGIITDVKIILGDMFIDTGNLQTNKRYTIAVPIPEKGIAYIFVMHSEDTIEKCGKAHFIPGD